MRAVAKTAMMITIRTVGFKSWDVKADPSLSVWSSVVTVEVGVVLRSVTVTVIGSIVVGDVDSINVVVVSSSSTVVGVLSVTMRIALVWWV